MEDHSRQSIHEPKADRRPTPDEVRRWLRTPGTVFGFGLILFTVMHCVFYLHPFSDLANSRDGTVLGQFGDLIGGYFGTAFALISILLLYLTLTSQQQQSEIDHFESRFCELIRMHRDNVAEFHSDGHRGRELFVYLVNEFRAILYLVNECPQEYINDLTQAQKCEIAFTALLYGVGPNSSRILQRELAHFDRGLVSILNAKLLNDRNKESSRIAFRLPFRMFDGHQSILGHYFRHLYQTVCFVDRRSHLTREEKYEYVRTIRAQLSTHEQALLLLNSLSKIGNRWRNNRGKECSDLVIKYKLVKNLPSFFFGEHELSLSEMFPKGYFEWESS